MTKNISFEEMKTIANQLYDAEFNRFNISPLSETWPQINIEQAYQIQQINTARRLANGERRIGCKIGLTSQSVQKQLGVDQPDFGILFNSMNYSEGEVIPLHEFSQCKVEAEIAFILKKDLDMSNPSLLDVMQAVDYMLPAIEIVGSRIKDWKITIIDTIADNASSSAFVLGTTPKKLSEVDLRLCGMSLVRNGEPISTGAGAACLGNPLNAVKWLAKTMVELETPLKAGEVILSGALGPMVGVNYGDVIEARINGLGYARAMFSEELETV